MKVRIRLRIPRDLLFWTLLILLLAIGIIWAFSWNERNHPMDGWETVNPDVEQSLDQLEREGDGQGAPAPDFPLSLNSATVAELQLLPGIGPVKAQAIVDYREQVGPFQSIEDVMQVKGIGEKTFEAIRDLITVP